MVAGVPRPVMDTTLSLVVDKRDLHFVRVVVENRRFRAFAILILWLLGHVAWTQSDQRFELLMILYLYNFRVRRGRLLVVAIMMQKRK